MEVALKNKTVFPKNVTEILRSLSLAHFFSQGLLVGSWVMLLYKKIFKILYTLRTFDIDFALEIITPTSGNFVDMKSGDKIGGPITDKLYAPWGGLPYWIFSFLTSSFQSFQEINH